jgi:hypothetical protein
MRTGPGRATADTGGSPSPGRVATGGRTGQEPTVAPGPCGRQRIALILARKYRITVPQAYRRYRAVLETEHRPRRGLRVTIEHEGGRKPLVAQWSGMSLARKARTGRLDDQPKQVSNSGRSELVARLPAETCERRTSARFSDLSERDPG